MNLSGNILNLLLRCDNWLWSNWFICPRIFRFDSVKVDRLSINEQFENLSTRAISSNFDFEFFTRTKTSHAVYRPSLPFWYEVLFYLRIVNSTLFFSFKNWLTALFFDIFLIFLNDSFATNVDTT